jgi:hypothetical protein
VLEKRWLFRLGPPLAALGVLAAIAADATGAADRTWEPPPCSPGVVRLDRTATANPPTDIDQAASGVWYRLDPQLVNGELSGQRLAIGWGAMRPRYVDLPPESFAAGPFGRTVLVGTDDGQSSSLRAIDLLGACAWSIAGDREVIRRATVAPDGRTVYLFRVDRSTRADLGVSRRTIDGGTEASVLGPLPADPGFGPTFTTELSWNVESDRLVVQSCAATACRTRLLDPATLDTVTMGDGDQGELIGVAEGLAVFRNAACGGLPCPIHSVTIATGEQRSVADRAGLARLVPTPRGARLIHEVAIGGGLGLRVVTLAGDEERTVPVAAGLRLVPSGSPAGVTRMPWGWVVLARDGRLGVDPEAETYVRLDDGSAVRRLEVLR